MRVEVSSVDKPSIDGLGVASSVVFKWRLPEVCGEGAVGDPSGGLFELSYLRGTFSMSFYCSYSVRSLASSLALSIA